ncbi:MAG: SGNH/GDSL hydrolase family protein [Ferruginibacter sp.]
MIIFKPTLPFVFCMLLFHAAHSQDWPNLKHYSSDNEKIGLPKTGEKRVVFMGNSITEFWKSATPDFFSGNGYINRGISGQTTPQMLIRFRADVVNLKPAVVLILAGVNDVAGNTGPSTLEMITDNIFSMAEIAKSNGIKVILCSVLPVYDFPWKPGLEPADKIIALNQMINDYAKLKGHIYLDYYSAMKDERNGMKAEYAKDGVHPTEAGYKVMMPLCTEAIKEALKK